MAGPGPRGFFSSVIRLWRASSLPWSPILAALFSVAGALGVARALGSTRSSSSPSPAASGARLVSLAPALTETLVALGAGDELVGVSDYDFAYGSCPTNVHPLQTTRKSPSNDCALSRLPRVGSWLTPNYEAVARLDATLVLTLDERSGNPSRLRGIAPVRSLKWLTVNDMSAGVRAIGDLTGRRARARVLADRIDSVLRAKPPHDAPSVLMVIGSLQSRLSEIWFVRPSSIHGAVLAAAGARNAVSEPVTGPPRLDPAQVVALDPDAILVLAEGAASAERLARFRAQWNGLGAVRAVKERRVGIVAGPGVHGVGPRVLDLVPRVRAELHRLFGAR